MTGGYQELRCGQRIPATPLVAVQKHDLRGGIVGLALDKPGADVLSVDGVQPVVLDRSPVDPLGRFREPRPGRRVSRKASAVDTPSQASKTIVRAASRAPGDETRNEANRLLARNPPGLRSWVAFPPCQASIR